ncbi:hypothetical protein ACFJGW_00955 [Burkholderiaceae bacterium UC74_6]
MPPRKLTAILSLVLLSACTREPALRWTEEVHLTSQLSVTVARESEFRGKSELGQPPSESRTTFQFVHPVTKELVKYETSYVATTEEMYASGIAVPGDPRLLQMPVALQFKDQQVYVVVAPTPSLSSFIGCPDPSLILYRWESGHWARRPLQEIPERTFRSNLTTSPHSERAFIERQGSHLSASHVNTNGPDPGVHLYDLSGMKEQTFERPPNCPSCTLTVKIGDRYDSPRVGPLCTSHGRMWLASEHLTN